jgi:hypothetical protein
MKGSLCLSLFFAGFLLLTLSAQAATVYFEGNCVWSSNHTKLNCVFDARRPSNLSRCDDGSLPQQYSWEFGDGAASSGYSSFTSRTYDPPPSGQYGYYPTLMILCPNGWSAKSRRDICISGFGYPGCIFQTGDWY